MTDEQIKQNVHDYTYTNDHNWTWDDSGEGRVDISAEISDAYIAGAHSRDEEIEELRKHDALENKMRIDLINECEQLKQELDKLRNPWISVEERLPELSRSEYDIDNMYLVCREGGSLVFNAIFRRNGKWYICDNMQTTEIIAPDYWMPMPQIKKGE